MRLRIENMTGGSVCDPYQGIVRRSLELVAKCSRLRQAIELLAGNLVSGTAVNAVRISSDLRGPRRLIFPRRIVDLNVKGFDERLPARQHQDGGAASGRIRGQMRSVEIIHSSGVALDQYISIGEQHCKRITRIVTVRKVRPHSPLVNGRMIDGSVPRPTTTIRIRTSSENGPIRPQYPRPHLPRRIIARVLAVGDAAVDVGGGVEIYDCASGADPFLFGLDVPFGVRGFGHIVGEH